MGCSPVEATGECPECDSQREWQIYRIGVTSIIHHFLQDIFRPFIYVLPGQVAVTGDCSTAR
jgi:hypothetical protein